jgi:hypothetical protein
MMKTEARLALSLRQRRFEWALARDEQARTAACLVAGRTHDLLNVLQVVRLVADELDRRGDAREQALARDLRRAADSAQRSLLALAAASHPPEGAVRGPPVGATVEAAVASLADAIAVDARIEAPPDAATRCTAEELVHLVIGLVLDAADAPPPADRPIALAVREREIDRAPWIELVRGCEAAPAGDRFELRVVEAIAQRAGGELASSACRGGGEEVVVALPEVA